jgi:hypothetical protein
MSTHTRVPEAKPLAAYRKIRSDRAQARERFSEPKNRAITSVHHFSDVDAERQNFPTSFVPRRAGNRLQEPPAWSAKLEKGMIRQKVEATGSFPSSPILAGIIVFLGMLGWPITSLAADARSAALREAAEYVLRKFGREAAQETAETFARKLENLVAKHGDDVLGAVRQVGPKAISAAAAAGNEAGLAYRLMARHGDTALVWIVARPKALRLVAQLGDDAAEVLLKHPGISEPLVEKFGLAATQALRQVNPQNGRRLAMLLDDGSLTATSRSSELLGVVGRFGDRAADFIWRNKGALTVSAALGAFLANPQMFLDGTARLVDFAGENVVKPVLETPGKLLVAAVTEGGLSLWLGLGTGLIVAWFLWRFHRRARISA